MPAWAINFENVNTYLLFGNYIQITELTQVPDNIPPLNRLVRSG
jgi:hypothetical protein